jgi:hypothetical protein
MKTSQASGQGSERPKNLETEHENQRTPDQDGKPPRPATEPAGSEDSQKSGKTATDPGSGEPNPK